MANIQTGSLLRGRRRGDDPDRPIEAALMLDEAHEAVIAQSHQRCLAIGLSRIRAPEIPPFVGRDLLETLDHNRRWLSLALPMMEMLHAEVARTPCMVVLTDARGTVIHSLGDAAFEAEASRVALRPGVNWSEPAKGTNGIGTALMSETPILVHAEEHFLYANQFLTSSATPIFDPRGNILGVLDVTGDRGGYHRHTMGLVRLAARMIENAYLEEALPHVLLLHFHGRAEHLGGLMDGRLAVRRDGQIVGANPGAIEQLGLSHAALRTRTLASLFGMGVDALADHFRRADAAPLMLHRPDGAACHARACFDWPRWHAVGRPYADIFPAARPAASEPPPPAAPQAQGLHHLETGDGQLQSVIGKLRKIVDRGIPLLIVGDTGTGKELLARGMHQESSRAAKPFVAVNCASIPETLIEAELFGYAPGAFTGACSEGALGKFEQACGGSLFLDEIGDMPLALQGRLLRVLQERRLTPLGSERSVTVDVALICATHRDLLGMIEAGSFREDLYYRLNGLVVKLPPLRERSDLPALIERLLGQFAGPPALQLAQDVALMFARYDWPGNLRQLASVLRTAAAMVDDSRIIGREHLSDDFLEDCERAALTRRPPAAGGAPVRGAGIVPPATIKEAEVETIRRALEAARGNVSAASKRLEISRSTIYRKLRFSRNRRAAPEVP